MSFRLKFQDISESRASHTMERSQIRSLTRELLHLVEFNYLAFYSWFSNIFYSVSKQNVSNYIADQIVSERKYCDLIKSHEALQSHEFFRLLNSCSYNRVKWQKKILIVNCTNLREDFDVNLKMWDLNA